MEHEQLLVNAAEQLAREHHAQYDSSHDILHVERVKNLSVQIAKSLTSASVPVDFTVVTLAAYFHDLIDGKYLPQGVKMTAGERLEVFWSSSATISKERRLLVERIVENVSYSKEVKRVAAGGETEWHSNCPELHCVQDADKLDAIGAFGILRCAAYSGAAGVPLFVPPSSQTRSSSTTASAPANKSSAIDHFHEKLVNLEGMMKTARGKELARKRTLFLHQFIAEIEGEWLENSGEESLPAAVGSMCSVK